MKTTRPEQEGILKGNLVVNQHETNYKIIKILA